MGDGMKDKEMASMLKKAGAARSTMRCPVCHGSISGVRIEPREGNPKGFSHYDFKGPLHGHFQRCGKGTVAEM